MPAEVLYSGAAHEATFYVPSMGVVRFYFSDRSAGGQIRGPDGALTTVHSGARLVSPAGQHVLTLDDTSLVARVVILFESG